MPRKSAFKVEMDPILKIINNAPAISSCPVTSQSEVAHQSTCTDPMAISQSLDPAVGLQRLVHGLSYRF